MSLQQVPHEALRASLDRELPAPLHSQLAECLRAEIVSGHWDAGLQLPPEPELARSFRVSRTTVRQALGQLEQGGLIKREKGRGTFVTSSRQHTWLLQSTGGFLEDETQRLGRMVTSTVLRMEREPLPLWASEALGLPPSSGGVTVERLRSVDAAVALYVVNYLPDTLADTVSELTQDASLSLYALLRARVGLTVAGARRSVEAVPADERLATLLGVEHATPLIYIESVSWDYTMRPFDCYRAWLRTDRMKLDIEVSSPSPTPT
jgi:GntR family transcriptional regulator